MQCVVRPPPGSQGKKAAQPTTKAARRTGRVVGATETGIRTPAPLQPPSFMPPCIGKRSTACDARRAPHRVCAAASHRSARPLPHRSAPPRAARSRAHSREAQERAGRREPWLPKVAARRWEVFALAVPACERETERGALFPRCTRMRVGKFAWQGVVDENTKAGTWAARRVQHTTSEVDPGATTALSWEMSTSGNSQTRQAEQQLSEKRTGVEP